MRYRAACLPFALTPYPIPYHTMPYPLPMPSRINTHGTIDTPCPLPVHTHTAIATAHPRHPNLAEGYTGTRNRHPKKFAARKMRGESHRITCLFCFFLFFWLWAQIWGEDVVSFFLGWAKIRLLGCVEIRELDVHLITF